jgi:GTP-binding protein
MKVRVRSATFAGVYPHNDAGLPQVAFAGRSNVGKSSLINALVNRKNLVHTSKTPGKTRSINLYRVETVELPPICLVDLPGYGFSRAPRSVTDSWEDALAAYLKDNPRLRLLVMLVDIRRDIGGYERMLSELMGTGLRGYIAATKAASWVSACAWPARELATRPACRSPSPRPGRSRAWTNSGTA